MSDPVSDPVYEEVSKILAILDASTLEELYLETGDFKLQIRRWVAMPPPAAIAAPAQFAVVAPMLGTFYRAPAPDAPPFVEVGAEVSPDDTLCIIEVMKLMNTIKAEHRGRVAAVLVENASMVEFGQSLIVFDAV
ncbi:MAG: acetyl-CoA carboxylase biotin carboxyl carrier protein [Vulcanimicrobiaceae bacterium]